MSLAQPCTQQMQKVMSEEQFRNNSKTVLSVKQPFSLCILSVIPWISWADFHFYLMEFILLNMIKKKNKDKKNHNKKARERYFSFVFFPQVLASISLLQAGFAFLKNVVAYTFPCP